MIHSCYAILWCQPIIGVHVSLTNIPDVICSIQKGLLVIYYVRLFIESSRKTDLQGRQRKRQERDEGSSLIPHFCEERATMYIVRGFSRRTHVTAAFSVVLIFLTVVAHCSNNNSQVNYFHLFSTELQKRRKK